MAIRTPPNSAETEAFVLSCMLFDDYGLSHGVTELTNEAFYNPNYKIIFSAMCKLYAENKNVDVITLAEKLREMAVYEQVGGLSIIADIASQTYTSAHIKTHITKLIEYHNKRIAVKYLKSVSKAIFEQSYSDFLNALGNIPNFEQAAKDKNTAELLQGAVTRANERYHNPDKMVGLMSGLQNLDFQVGGFRDEELIYITAAPNVGKSLFVLQMCLKAAIADKTAAYFNFEMSEENVADRILTMSLSISAQAIQNPRKFLSREDCDKINKTDLDEKLAETLFIYTNAPPTINTIISKCKGLRAKGKPPSVIAVDYLQLMSAQ